MRSAGLSRANASSTRRSSRGRCIPAGSRIRCDVLTPREREVLALSPKVTRNSAIARHLFIAERTVESHTTLIFQKLGLDDTPDVHRRVSAVLAYSGSA